MRQRKVKNLETKYEAYEDIIIYDPPSMKGHWRELSGGRPVYLEIGCGKGRFISAIAVSEPGNYFFAVEGNKSVMLRALEKIRAAGAGNVIFYPGFAGDLREWFEPGEVSGIYLNFSDPLPKNRLAKKRLTYRERLISYAAVLDKDGSIVFKTDNTDLFEWTLGEIEAAELVISDLTRDLHSDPERLEGNIETEYEAKYGGLGETIKRVIIRKGTAE